MKRIGLLVLACLALPLAGCFNLGKSKKGESGDTSNNTSQTSESVSSTTESESLPPEEEKKQTYNFYIDYWHSDEPMYTMKWYQGRPLGECPKECMLTSSDATDPAFPVFLGWSIYSSAIDEDQLWDFKTSSKLNTIVNLYGIWVSK